MGGCLECAEADGFDYGVKHNVCVATKKNGKTYLHFYNGIISDAVALKSFPSLPKSIRLMNTGEYLEYVIEPLPDVRNEQMGRSDVSLLHIYGIPSDELVSEPIVLEIEW